MFYNHYTEAASRIGCQQLFGHCPWLQLSSHLAQLSQTTTLSTTDTRDTLLSPGRSDQPCLHGIHIQLTAQRCGHWQPAEVQQSREMLWKQLLYIPRGFLPQCPQLSLCPGLFLFQPLCKHLLPLLTPPEAKGSITLIAFAPQNDSL